MVNYTGWFSDIEPIFHPRKHPPHDLLPSFYVVGFDLLDFIKIFVTSSGIYSKILMSILI